MHRVSGDPAQKASTDPTLDTPGRARGGDIPGEGFPADVTLFGGNIRGGDSIADVVLRSPDLLLFSDEQLRDALLERGIEWETDGVRLHRLPWMSDEQSTALSRFAEFWLGEELGLERDEVGR